MAYTKQNYQPGDVLTAEQMNKIQDAIIINEGNIEGHIANHNALPAIEDIEYPGCYYRIVDGEKEWINPPLMLNTRYRTTERFEGRPVYVKMLTFGKIETNEDSASIELGETGFITPLRCSAYAISGQQDWGRKNLPIFAEKEGVFGYANVYATSTNVTFKTYHINFNDELVIATVWFTISTEP